MLGGCVSKAHEQTYNYATQYRALLQDERPRPKQDKSTEAINTIGEMMYKTSKSLNDFHVSLVEGNLSELQALEKMPLNHYLNTIVSLYEYRQTLIKNNGNI